MRIARCGHTGPNWVGGPPISPTIFSPGISETATMVRHLVGFCGFMLALALFVPASLAQEISASENAAGEKAAGEPARDAAQGDAKPAAAAEQPKPKYPPYAEVIKEHETIDGLIKLHRKGNRLL